MNNITGSYIESKFQVNPGTGCIDRLCQDGVTWKRSGYIKPGEKKRFRVSGYNTPDAAYEVASNFAKSAHGKFYNPGKQ